MHNILLSAISGMKVGIEFFLGGDLVDGDKFAMSIDLFIVRLTYIYSTE